METLSSSSQAFTTPNPPLPPSRRKFWLSVILALFFLLGVTYYYLFYARPLPTTTQAPVATASSQSSSVNSANWKTYQNSKWAVSFTYPETWSISEPSLDQVTAKSDSKLTPDQFSWMLSQPGIGFCEGQTIKSTSTVDMGHGISGSRTECADPTSGVIGDIVIQYSNSKSEKFMIIAHYKSYQGKQVLEEVINSFTPSPA